MNNFFASLAVICFAAVLVLLFLKQLNFSPKTLMKKEEKEEESSAFGQTVRVKGAYVLVEQLDAERNRVIHHARLDSFPAEIRRPRNKNENYAKSTTDHLFVLSPTPAAMTVSYPHLEIFKIGGQLYAKEAEGGTKNGTFDSSGKRVFDLRLESGVNTLRLGEQWLRLRVLNDTPAFWEDPTDTIAFRGGSDFDRGDYT